MQAEWLQQISSINSLTVGLTLKVYELSLKINFPVEFNTIWQTFADKEKKMYQPKCQRKIVNVHLHIIPTY